MHALELVVLPEGQQRVRFELEQEEGGFGWVSLCSSASLLYDIVRILCN